MRNAIVAICAAISICSQSVAQNSLTQEQQEVIRQALKLPAGSSITLEQTTTRDGGFFKMEEEATGLGAGLNARGEKIVSDFNAGAPESNLSGKGNAVGTSIASSTSVLGSSNLWSNPLLWVGIVLVLASAGSMAIRPPTFPVAIPIRATLVTASVGIAFICAVLFPTFSLFIVAVGVLAVAAPYVYREFANQRIAKQADEAQVSHNALRSVAAGISDFKAIAADPKQSHIPPEMWNRLKDALESHLTDEEKAVIQKIRRQDGLS
jgi:hypothetical protein